MRFSTIDFPVLTAPNSPAASLERIAALSRTTRERIVDESLIGGVRLIAPVGRARAQRPVVAHEQDDAAIGGDESEERTQDLGEELVEVVLGADVARELDDHPHLLVVVAELPGVLRDGVVGEEAAVRRADLGADRPRAVLEADPRHRRPHRRAEVPDRRVPRRQHGPRALRRRRWRGHARRHRRRRDRSSRGSRRGRAAARPPG